jgi:hypothetical protein
VKECFFCEPPYIYLLLFSEKPKLWLDGIIGRKIKVRAGEPINIDIPLTGAPTPKIEWLKKGVVIPETNRVYVSC